MKRSILVADPNRDLLPVPAIRKSLLAWYDRHQRRLPWRAIHPQRPNPYHVLVSEAMLQQTQVSTVLAYFERFVNRFPDLQNLAEADEQEVLRLWQGLGYYRRARNLHAAARIILRDHEGQIPSDIDQLLALPGVGRYTAGAIASIAFGQPEPVLDGNVARVLARWQATDEPVDQPAVRQRQWSIAQKLVPKNRPGDFNQALMELGAVVCTPRQPDCLHCPAARWCQAWARHLQHVIPRMGARTKPLAVTHHALAIQRRRRGIVEYLWMQRPERGLWGKLWQLPTLETAQQTIDAQQLRAWANQQLDLCITSPRVILRFDHATSHRAIHFVLWMARLRSPVISVMNHAELGWHALDQLDQVPMANPPRSMVQFLRQKDS